MSTFASKCPKCGIDLAAEEADIGAKVSCPECDYHFMLRKETQIALNNSQDILAPATAATSNEMTAEAMTNLENSFSFDAPLNNVAHSQPYLVTVGKVAKNVNCWKDVLRFVALMLYERHTKELLALRKKAIPGFTKRICLTSSSDSESLHAPHKVANDLWIETNLSAMYIVKLSVSLATECGVDLKMIKVFYTTKPTEVTSVLFESVPTAADPIFEKKLDRSTFVMGITIPVRHHECFLAHLDIPVLPRGKYHPVRIKIGEHYFNANILSPDFTNRNRTAVIQILWGKNSAIAKFLQTTYREIYAALVEQRGNRNILTKSFTVALAADKGCFEFVTDKSPECSNIFSGHETNKFIEIGSEAVIEILSTRFPHGYRISANIDFEKFKNFYFEKYGEEFKSGSGDLDAFVKSIAVVFDDRAYIYNAEAIEIVRAYLEQMDSPCIYIGTFFRSFSDKLYAWGIFSVDMLRAFIDKYYKDIFCKRDYLYLQSDASPSDLIRQLFAKRETWSLDDLFDKLPCLKQDTIRAILNGSNYLRIETGMYTHIDNMDLPDNEGEQIITFVREKLQNKDYVIANELDLSQFEILNLHCPFSAVRDAVFNKFLSNQYSKSGQVITRIGKKLHVLDILEQYCRDAGTASVEELKAFEATFDPDGRTHSTCLIAAHNVMVRVSADLFVAESMISFDVEKTDEIISLYCRDNFISLKNVVDFSLFPYAGYPWNLFLLESYVRKFSHLFKYDIRAVNSANIGVIVRKSYIYREYDDILATALAKSSVSLNNKKAVGDYLFDNGYIGWRNLGKNENKILAAAKKLREEGTV